MNIEGEIMLSEEVHEVLKIAADAIAYWKSRCQAAEEVIESCDYHDAMGAKSRWRQIASLEKEFINES